MGFKKLLYFVNGAYIQKLSIILENKVPPNLKLAKDDNNKSGSSIYQKTWKNAIPTV